MTRVGVSRREADREWCGDRAVIDYIEREPRLPEIVLLGGDVTGGVVRVGDTVRRPLNAQSPAVHAYLRHLECVGFAESPRYLGIDSRGREVLTYVHGETGGRPLHPWAAKEGVLAGIARPQRRAVRYRIEERPFGRVILTL